MCGPTASVAQLHALLIRRRNESVADVAVCGPSDGSDRRLLGLIPMDKVLAARPYETAGTLMDPAPVVAPGLDQAQAAGKAGQHGESSLAVVDDDESGSGTGCDAASRGC